MQTFSTAVNYGSKWWNWKMNPILVFLKFANFLGERVFTSWLLIKISPLSAW